MRRNDPGNLMCCVAVALAAFGCARAPAPDLLAQTDALIQDGRWDDAAESAKQQLMKRPDDVAAHFYLGRCFLNGPVFYPGAAEGEFQTALRLFKESGGQCPIREYGSEYFELRCHLELAKVYLRKYYELADRGAPKTILRKPLMKLAAEAKAAEALAPDSPDVRELNRIVERL